MHVNSKSNVGGVGEYVSDLLQYKQLTFCSTFAGCETIWMEITFPNTKINYVVGTVYRHPTTNVNQFCEFLNDILTELNINHKKYFILGDMNLNTSNAILSISCQMHLNMLNTNCSTNIINLLTRVTSTTATILDHIISNYK